MTFINNVRTAFASDAPSENADRGQLVEMVLIIAGFAIVAILAVNWIGTAILNKGVDVSSCIEGSNTYNSGNKDGVTAASKACSTNTAKTKSFKNDAGYKTRY